jgi:3-keto-5-aminohexanoate cleavage enzyme
MKLPEDKVIITVAQTGGLVTKKMNPNVPGQPEEIAESAYDCYNEGAAIAHIHARDRDGVPTGSAEIFRDIHERIRKRCNIIIQDSTGGGLGRWAKNRQRLMKQGRYLGSSRSRAKIGRTNMEEVCCYG